MSDADEHIDVYDGLPPDQSSIDFETERLADLDAARETLTTAARTAAEKVCALDLADMWKGYGDNKRRLSREEFVEYFAAVIVEIFDDYTDREAFKEARETADHAEG